MLPSPGKYKIVIIGGLHRSGTSLINSILGQHKQISIFKNTKVHEDEGQFLQSVYPTDNEYGGPGRFAFDKRAHLTEKSELLNKYNKKMLWDEWSKYWDINKPVLLEKSPFNIIKSRFLQAVFPNAYFIFVIRHPIPTSLATHKWSGTGIYSLIHHWLVCHETLAGDISYLKRSITITYESFVSIPDQVIKKIEDFMEIDNHSYDISIDPTSNEKYFKIWLKLFMKKKERTKPIPKLGAVHDHKQRFPNINYTRLVKSYIKNKLYGEERQMSHTVYESQDAVEMFDDRVKNLGYSLVDLQKMPRSPMTIGKPIIKDW